MFVLSLRKNGRIEARRTNSISLFVRMTLRAIENGHFVSWSCRDRAHGLAVTKLLAQYELVKS